jgi:predicted 2-oxoglutarate/Fe(II)-dependent dioxygenase YbiX
MRKRAMAVSAGVSRVSKAARPRVSFTDETPELGERLPFAVRHFDVFLRAQETEQEFRRPWVQGNMARLEALGGWGIDWQEPAPTAALLCRVPLALGRQTEDVHVVEHALPSAWCRKLIAAHEAVGFTSQQELDVTVGSEQKRQVNAMIQERRRQVSGDYAPGKNTSEVLELESPELAAALWARLGAFVPSMVDYQETGQCAVAGIIPTFRFMKYRPGAAFRPHKDPARLLQQHPATGAPGSFRSLVTIAVFLNDFQSEFDGGELSFVEPVQLQHGQGLVYESLAKVQPHCGHCAIFRHDQLHESTPILRGVKFMFQLDVAYELPSLSRH